MVRNILVLLCLLSATNGFAQSGKNTEKKNDAQIDYKEIGSPMPRIRMIVYQDSTAKESSKKKKEKNKETATPSVSSVVLTNKELDNGANLFIMLFNPTCSHCEEETAMLEKNMSLFKNSKVLMMATPVMQPYLGGFVQMLHTNDYPHITVGVDSAGYMNEVFLYQALPQINIYSRDRKLLKTYSGEVSIDTLQKYIE